MTREGEAAVVRSGVGKARDGEGGGGDDNVDDSDDDESGGSRSLGRPGYSPG